MEESRNSNEENGTKVKKRTATDEIKETISSVYRVLENWVRPNKNQPIILQIAIFILKLPVLFLLLLFSPILLVVLLLVFLIAL